MANPFCLIHPHILIPHFSRAEPFRSSSPPPPTIFLPHGERIANPPVETACLEDVRVRNPAEEENFFNAFLKPRELSPQRNSNMNE